MTDTRTFSLVCWLLWLALIVATAAAWMPWILAVAIGASVYLLWRLYRGQPLRA